mgnify:CR=1 FL=1
MSDTKVCTQCKREKPIEEFAVLRRLSTGRRAQCKACDSKYRGEKRGTIAPQDGDIYELNQATMKNHMKLHFGFYESRKHTDFERMRERRDIRKYYRSEQSPEFKKDV